MGEENFKNLLALSSVGYSIENKIITSSENFKVRINDLSNFFDDVVKGLESIINLRLGIKEYHLVENLKEIVEASGYQCQGSTKEDVEKIIKGFKNTMNQLKNLEKNPKKFYETKDAEKLLNLCNNIKNIYLRDTKIFECESFVA